MTIYQMDEIIMKKVLLFLATCWLSVAQAASPQINVFSTSDQLAEEASNVVIKEIQTATSAGYPLVIIIPTGKTAIPFYEKFIQKAAHLPTNLDHVSFFNMDEYAGPGGENSDTFHAFMEQHLFEPLQDQYMIDISSHFHIPHFSNDLKEAAYFAKLYETQLMSAIKQPSARVIAVGGIGVNPAHIAFNEFTFDEDIQKAANADEKLALAKSSRTRLVELDHNTVYANDTPFKHAITIGFDTLLEADKIVIMANTSNKKEAVEMAFKSEESIEIPASLLKSAKGKVDFFVTEEVGIDLSSLQPLEEIDHTPAALIDDEQVASNGFPFFFKADVNQS